MRTRDVGHDEVAAPLEWTYRIIAMTVRAWLVAAMLCLPLDAQDSGYRERIEVEWVLVPAVVRTPSGYVHGLGRDDFELRVDGRPVAVESFEAAGDAPMSLVHLQDLSGSMALSGKIDASRRLLTCILDRARPGDELAVATFASGRIRVEVPFTGEVAALRDAMDTWRGYGTTALHDAVAWLPTVAVHDHSVKRAALLVTDGADNASVLEPARARELVRRAKLPVYVLGLATGSPFELDRRGRKKHRHADVLNLLAHLTGGRYHSVTGEDVEEVCATIVQDLRSQYILGFATGGAGPPRYRSIEVKVRGKKRSVLHRQGYTGRSPAAEP